MGIVQEPEENNLFSLIYLSQLFLCLKKKQNPFKMKVKCVWLSCEELTRCVPTGARNLSVSMQQARLCQLSVFIDTCPNATTPGMPRAERNALQGTEKMAPNFRTTPPTLYIEIYLGTRILLTSLER